MWARKLSSGINYYCIFLKILISCGLYVFVQYKYMQDRLYKTITSYSNHLPFQWDLGQWRRVFEDESSSEEIEIHAFFIVWQSLQFLSIRFMINSCVLDLSFVVLLLNFGMFVGTSLQNGLYVERESQYTYLNFFFFSKHNMIMESGNGLLVIVRNLELVL